MNIEFCEREQSFCSVDYFVVSASIECIVSKHSDFYEKEQFCFSVDVDTDDIVDVVVTRIDALTLTADMIKKKKKSV